jgi:hypothetical protein
LLLLGSACTALANAPAVVEDDVYFLARSQVPYPTTSGSVLVAPTTPDGDYAVTQVIAADPNLDLSRAWGIMVSVDLDGDGRSNLLGSTAPDVRYDFADGREVSFDAPLDPCSIEWTGDWNGDGLEDLASSATAWVSTGSGFEVAARIGVSETCRFGDPVVLGDVDGDGGDDLLTYVPDTELPPPPMAGTFWADDRRYGGRWSLFLSADLGAGTWAPRWTVDSARFLTTDAAAPLDVDGDGRPELVGWLQSQDPTGVTYGELVVYGDLTSPSGPRELARGSAPLTEVAGWYVWTYPRLVPVGDWDGDGDGDLLVDSYGFGEVTRAVVDVDLAREALWTVVDRLELPRRAPPEVDVTVESFPTVADFDGDGTLDVVYSVSEDGVGSRSWFTGPGRDFPTALVTAPTGVEGTQRSGEGPAGCSHAEGGWVVAGVAALVARRIRRRG